MYCFSDYLANSMKAKLWPRFSRQGVIFLMNENLKIFRIFIRKIENDIKGVF